MPREDALAAPCDFSILRRSRRPVLPPWLVVSLLSAASYCLLLFANDVKNIQFSLQ